MNITEPIFHTKPRDYVLVTVRQWDKPADTFRPALQFIANRNDLDKIRADYQQNGYQPGNVDGNLSIMWD